MNPYRLSEFAQADLDAIWAYVAKENRLAADKLVLKFARLFEKLAGMPGMGPVREDLGVTFRSFPLGSYVVFYQPTELGIEVVRVVHGSRDLPTLFQAGSRDEPGG